MKKSPIQLALSLIAVNIIFMQFPILNIFLYPFIIISTWFHEMGHGIMALLLGGGISKIQIFPDGSGIATLSNSGSLGNLGNALIAISGPLLPPLLGYLYLTSTKNIPRTRLLLFLSSTALFVSTLLWVRSTFGFFFLLFLSVIIFFYFNFKLDKISNRNFSIYWNTSIYERVLKFGIFICQKWKCK